MQKAKHIIFLLLISSSVSAQQQPLFSHYLLNGFGFNPALAGSSGSIDTRLSYRRQWVGLEDAPMTQVLSAHAPVGRRLGLGGYFFNDAAGQLQRTGGSVAVSYGFEFQGIGRLSIGVSGTGGNVRLKNGNEQDVALDPSLAETGKGGWVPEVSAGLFFQVKNGLYFGISAPQIYSKPLNSNDIAPGGALVPHYFGMAGYRRQLSERFAVEPSVLVKYAEGTPLQYDASLRAILNGFWVGGTYRAGEAAAVLIGWESAKGLTIAYAYDLAINELKTVNSGSHELTLGYKFGKPKDRDADGIADNHDRCPDEPGVRQENGCPEKPTSPPPPDRDGDGTPDFADRCPDVPGGAFCSGCPVACDADQDGIVDEKDKCPDQAGSFADAGCPALDADGDGIPNEDDLCPKTPGETFENGCPAPTALEENIRYLAENNLRFEVNKSDINKSSFSYLDKLAELVVSKPGWKVRIQGHTDDTGSAEHNLRLSKERAEAVHFYLRNRGVPKEQLVVEYYGESMPAASNANAESRLLNRRVEMVYVWD